MKTFGLWLKMAGLCLMFALAFPACSDDDEEKEEPGGVENVKTGWSEDGNTATFKYSYTVPGTKYTVAYVYVQVQRQFMYRCFLFRDVPD